MVKGAQQIVCETCNRHVGPKTRKPAHIVRPLDFNQEVCLDALHLYDMGGKKVTTLSMLDAASGYHLVKRMEGTKAEDFVKTFLEGWVTCAGPPVSVLVDQERGMVKDFPDVLEQHGIAIRYTAGQALAKRAGGATKRLVPGDL